MDTGVLEGGEGVTAVHGDEGDEQDGAGLLLGRKKRPRESCTKGEGSCVKKTRLAQEIDSRN